jgi:hypothetical protein
MKKVLSGLGWLVLTVAAIGLTAYCFSLQALERDLASRAAELRQRVVELRADRKRGVAATYNARYCRDATWRKDHKLQEMMRACSSRDNFIVREGPRIAWSELANTDGRHTIGFYVPEGKHRLRARLFRGVYVQSNPPKPVELSNSVKTDTAVTCELGPQAEVYELQFWWDIDAGLPRIRVIGQGNEVIHEEALPGMDGRRITRLKVRGTGLAYPSELDLEDEAQYKQPSLSRPVTELARFQFSGKSPDFELQWWIESDAPPCVSAVEAAAFYDALTQLLTPHERRRSQQTPNWSARDQAFQRTFKPYDGSDRLYFRDGVFDSLKAK